jgi:hypothetical protein
VVITIIGIADVSRATIVTAAPDTPGYSAWTIFGSPHANGFHTNYWAWGINDNDVVVGAGNDPSHANHIFAMKSTYNSQTETWTTTNLGTLTSAGYDMSRAYSVNHNGDAVGCAYLYSDSNNMRAVVLRSDGTVNIADLSNVLTNYDKTLSESSAGIRAVPEPSSIVFLVVGALSLLACSSGKRM